jgi:hypothetical protein
MQKVPEETSRHFPNLNLAQFLKIHVSTLAHVFCKGLCPISDTQPQEVYASLWLSDFRPDLPEISPRNETEIAHYLVVTSKTEPVELQ